jgi:hypothetical protein
MYLCIIEFSIIVHFFARNLVSLFPISCVKIQSAPAKDENGEIIIRKLIEKSFISFYLKRLKL